jgi:hypothetical protein
MLNANSWTQNPVLLYGCRKSGTTLALNLLDGTQDAVVSPAEIKLKRLFTRSARSEAELRRAYVDNAIVGQYGNEGFDSGAYERAIEDDWTWSDCQTIRDYLIRDIELQLFCMRRKPLYPRMWIMKEVSGNAGDVLLGYRNLFPDGKLVLIVRSPLMIVSAVLRNRRAADVRVGIRRIWQQVREAMTLTHTLLGLAGEPAVHLLPYEIITAPVTSRDAIRRLCAFLSVEFNEEMLKPSVFGIHGVVRTASRAEPSIFPAERPWWHGLSPTEAVLAGLFHGVCWLAISARDRQPFLYRKLSGRKYAEQSTRCDQLAQS